MSRRLGNKTFALVLVSALACMSSFEASVQQSPDAQSHFPVQNPAPAQFQSQANPESGASTTHVEQKTTITEMRSEQVQAQTESDLNPTLKPRAVEPQPTTTTAVNSQNTKVDPKHEAAGEQKASGQVAVKEQTTKTQHPGKCTCPCEHKATSGTNKQAQKTVKSGQSTVKQAPAHSGKSTLKSESNKAGQELKHAGQKVEQGVKSTEQKVQEGWHNMTKSKSGH